MRRRWGPGIELSNDLSPATWVLAALEGDQRPGRVGGFVPAGFEAYGRILHPPEAAEGRLPARECGTLASLLGTFTSTPGTCWFCVWDGYGVGGSPLIRTRPRIAYLRARARARIERSRRDRWFRSLPRVHTRTRDYLLFRGDVASAATFWPSPNIWWPQDRAWCVATDIDARSTYLGGGRACVDGVLSSNSLEAMEVSIDSPFDPGPDLRLLG